MFIFDWFKQYLCTGEHSQSDLDIFQFDFMFVKPHDVPPLLCFNVQTEIRFGVEQLPFPEGRRCKKQHYVYPRVGEWVTQRAKWRPFCRGYNVLIHAGPVRQWASCQIPRIACAHAPGMLGRFSPPPRVRDPDMHHGTCVTHVPWGMPGSITNRFLWNRRWGETFPAFPAHAQPAIICIW